MRAPEPRPSVHPTAVVSAEAELGAGTVVWALAEIREGARVGADCVIGRGVYVDAGVRVGSGCKLEDNALVYQPARLGDGVFIGPGAVLTNDKHPRAVTPSMKPKDGADWAAAGVSVGDGASIGAGAIVLAGVTVGRWAMLGAGTVVTSDVVDYALMAGNPSRRVGWVGPSGLRLTPDGEGTWRCPVTGACFVERDGTLRESP